MSKKVGIITVHDIYNYGSILQAYASQRVVSELGYEVELIDYQYPNPYHGQVPSLKGKLLSFANQFLKDLLPGKKYKTYTSNYKDFKEKHYQLSAKRYPSKELLFENPPDYDIYMAGSDQLWRPKFIKGDPSFFLDFVQNKKKIAYASSFGCTSIPEEYKAAYAGYLNQFDSIGVREKPGVDIVKELTSKEAQVVLDPTLLLDKKQWSEVMKPYKAKKPYILCYGLSDKTNYMERLATHLKHLTGYEVIRINGSFLDYFDTKINFVLDAGPAEWLSLFSNAELILGQSFHATAFAINFGKPVIPILRGDEDHDSRQKQFLSLLNLEHLALTVGDSFPKNPESILNVGYSTAQHSLKSAREGSREFLRKSLLQ